MTAARLKYLSNATVEGLRENLSENLDRYRSGNFDDLVATGDWSIELNLDVDLAPLSGLDPSGTPEAEIANSRLVWKSLHGLTPTLACEEGVWTRLTHVEGLDFARSRWLRPDMDNDAVEKAVADHFFAPTLTGRRDDNAVSRLWWNAYIAHLAAPGSDLKALDLILKKADIRSNFVERSLTASRPPLAAGIVRIMRREDWVTNREENFRAFMRTLNRLGGGMVFESMSEADVDTFMDQCAGRAGLPSGEIHIDHAN
jgi:Family of unknown function (DUF6339)